MKYIIKGIPPSNNQFAGRKNVHEYRAAKKVWEEIVFYECRPRPAQPIKKATVTLTYFFKTHGRRDPDNYSGKFLLDGLVKAGILQDDCFNCISLTLMCDYDKINPRVEILISEVI
jgi:Holliday junction resolvase RusA-like endonuclease